MSKLLAPNGNPSNLTAEQYYLVRTPQFKAWFGDWEKLALTKIYDSGIDEISLKRLEDGVSKVVDKNGEPMVVYHGTPNKKVFNIFDVKKVGYNSYNAKKGFYFTDNQSVAYSYTYDENKEEYNGYVIQVFLNIKNIFEIDVEYKNWVDISGLNFNIDKEIENILNTGFDGLVVKNIKDPFIDDENGTDYYGNTFVVINPNQIKLADGTNTTFDGNNPDIRFKKGGRTIAQTPAPKKDQIEGSDKNKEGSSKDLKSAKQIELSDKTIETIKNKVDKHNEKHPNKKITLDSAKAVVRRGMGAYSSSHRPTISGGKPNSRVAWGLARLNAFLYKIVNGKSKSGRYSQDNDLIEELGYKVQKYSDGGDIKAYEEAMDISEFKDGGEAKSKKVYVSIRLDKNLKKTPNTLNKYFYDYDEKTFEELKNQKLKDLVGVSSSPNNIAEWFILRDCLIVMNYQEFIAINETEKIDYYDPYQLMKNNLYLFRRLYSNVTRYGEQENAVQQTLTKILQKIVPEINLEMNLAKGQKYKELYRISQFLNPHETRAFPDWIEENKIKIESPIDVTNAILDFNKLNDNWLGRGFENPVLTFDELLPIVEKGIIKASSIYDSEQEIVLINRELNIPKNSQLFFVGKDEFGNESESNRLELIEKYNLKQLYKIYFVDRQQIQKYRDFWLKKEEEKFNKKLEQGREELEFKKDQVVQELLDYFLEKSLNSIKSKIEKHILDYSNSLEFYNEKEDDYNEQYFYSIPIVESIIETYISTIKNSWKIHIQSKQVKDLDINAFYMFYFIVKQELISYFENKKDETDKLLDYRNVKSGDNLLDRYIFEGVIIKSVDDYQDSPEWIDFKELSKMYLDKMGKELYRYYDKKDLNLISQYNYGGEANELNLTKNKKMENEILIVEMNMYFNDTSVNFKNKEIPLKLNAPKNQNDFIDWSEENNIEFEQWGDFWNHESDLIDTPYGYTFEIPLFKYIEYMKTEKLYTGAEEKTNNKEFVFNDSLKEHFYGNPNNQEVMFHDEHKQYFYEDFIDGKFVTVWLGKNYVPNNQEKMEEGGKVESISSKKGDIKLMLDENWYSDDTEVELVPVSELVKFREFDRKVTPKYNQENSVDNINHLKFMFQKDGVKSPLIIEYSKEDNAVLIIEGNHRLNSAIDLGMEYLPARVVLKKYSKFTKNQLKNAMKVSGVEGNEFGYIPSYMKPSIVGVQGTKPIVFGDGGIIEGRLHSECDAEEGCGRKFQVGENGHIIEAERDEAVIVADAFENNEELTVKGTPSEIASALNVLGGGKNFDKGAEIIKDGQELDIPELQKEAIDTDVDDVIDSGSIIINRRSMADEKEYEVTGTPKQIASAINSVNGNGVVIEKGAEIKES